MDPSWDIVNMFGPGFLWADPNIQSTCHFCHAYLIEIPIYEVSICATRGRSPEFLIVHQLLAGAFPSPNTWIGHAEASEAYHHDWPCVFTPIPPLHNLQLFAPGPGQRAKRATMAKQKQLLLPEEEFGRSMSHGIHPQNMALYCSMLRYLQFWVFIVDNMI